MPKGLCKVRPGQYTSNGSIRSIYCMALTLLLSVHAHGQSNVPETATQLTINELVAIGDQATGGYEWPSAQLDQLPLDEVIATANACLAAPAAQINSHAICVFVLLYFNQADVFESLAAHFDNLNERGQFEVLLQGYYNKDPKYAPLFTSAVRASMNEPPDRVIALAAVYATTIYEENLLAALTDYHDQHTATIANSSRFYMDGLPYVDVSKLYIESLESAFSTALAFGGAMAGIADAPMSTREQALLKELRDALLAPPRIDIPVQARTLAELIETLNSQFEGQTFTLTDADGTLAPMHTDIGGNALSSADIAATLCNDLNLDVSAISDDDGWRIGKRNEYGNTEARNICTSHGSLVARLRHFDKMHDGIRRPRLEVLSSSKLYMYMLAQFSLEKLSMENGVTVSNTPVIEQRMSSFRLPAGDVNSDQSFHFDVQGTLSIAVPAHIKTIEQIIVPGVDNLPLQHGPFALEVRDASDGFWVYWGTPRPCCVNAPVFSPPTISSGLVALLDDADDILAQRGFFFHEPRGSVVVDYGHDSLNNALALFKNAPDYQQPAKLIWTVAPVMERVEFDIEFNDVQVTERTSP